MHLLRSGGDDGRHLRPLLLTGALPWALGALLLLGACGGSPPPGPVHRDVVFCTPQGSELKLDLFLPPPVAGRQSPLAIYVHGGSLSGGDKSAAGEIRPLSAQLPARGIAVAAINYRVYPLVRWPAMLDDTRCAVGFLRAHAAGYGLDPNRFGAWGESAGGQLVGLLATDPSLHLKAAVDMYGPSDLAAPDYGPGPWVAQNIAGVPRSAAAAALQRMSPVAFVSPGNPPFLIFHGDRDTTVLPNQSIELRDRLAAAGVPVTLVTVHNAGHGFAAVGGAISPSLAEIDGMVAEFFGRNL